MRTYKNTNQSDQPPLPGGWLSFERVTSNNSDSDSDSQSEVFQYVR